MPYSISQCILILVRVQKNAYLLPEKKYSDVHPFLSFLKQRLQQTLPGKAAQMKMAPSPVSGGRVRLYDAPEHVRKSSVLVPFIQSEEHGLELLLTLRAAHIKHGGQISFPGGRLEGNEQHEAAALREAHEEVGILPSNVELIGRSSDLYVNHSNNHVTPVVGFLKERPKMILQREEVDEAFFIPFSQFVSNDTRASAIWELQASQYNVPFWNIHRVPLWGATAMMLSEIVELYIEFESLNPD